jgi:hypothetical protein
MHAHAHSRGAQQAPQCLNLSGTCIFGMDFMNLQRISDFAEIQVVEQLYFRNNPLKGNSYILKFSPK